MAASELVVEELFGREAVKRLTASDFLLDTTTPIQLKWTDCIVILFYVDNAESRNLVQIWATAANVVAGPIFAAINLNTENEVAQAFLKIRESRTPYRFFGLKGYPFIIAYQGGYPVAFYNGDRDVQAIADWTITLACKNDYFEPIQLAASVHIDKSFEMGGVNPYQPRMNSLAFTAGNPIRQYNPQLGIVETGSQAAAVAAAQEAAARAAAGVTVGPTERGETPTGVIGTAAPGTAVAGGTPVATQQLVAQ